VTPRRRRNEDDFYGGEIGPLYSAEAAARAAESATRPTESGRATVVVGDPTAYEPDRPPSLSRRVARGLDDWRRRILPLPDEVIDQYLGHGERMIHSDHPSFQAFAVQNTILFLVLFVVAAGFLGVSFNGSFASAGVIFLVLGIVLLYLVLKRLRERYTSYVVTNVRIMLISGIFSRRAHSIPWVRVTDLTYEQTLIGRLFGYATLHIESANEEGGLRDLEGVSDPLRFNQYVIDMVVAKQGPTAPGWEQQGEPAPIISVPRRTGITERLRARSRRRAAARAAAAAAGSSAGGEGSEGTPAVAHQRRPLAAPVRVDLPESERVTGPPSPAPPFGEGDDEQGSTGSGTGSTGSGSSSSGSSSSPPGDEDLDWLP
jgi:membrane protein YdbS with pleckstrin-like domain